MATWRPEFFLCKKSRLRRNCKMAMHYEITTTVQKAKVNGDITENKSALTQEELRQTREKTYAYSSPFLRCAV